MSRLHRIEAINCLLGLLVMLVYVLSVGYRVPLEQGLAALRGQRVDDGLQKEGRRQSGAKRHIGICRELLVELQHDHLRTDKDESFSPISTTCNEI